MLNHRIREHIRNLPRPVHHEHKSGQQILEEAILENDIEKIGRLHRSTVVEFRHDEYKNAFLFAVRNAGLDTVQAIVQILRSKLNHHDYEQMVTADDQYDRSALFLAAIANNILVLSYLRTNLNFRVNDRNHDNYSALTFAMERDSRQAFNYLLLHGAKFSETEQKALAANQSFKRYFNSPECFLVIAESGNLDAITLILRHIKGLSDNDQRPFLTAENEDDRNALMLAARHDHDPLIPLLLSFKFDLNAQDYANHSTLYYLLTQNRMHSALKLLQIYERIPESEVKHIQRYQDQFVLDTKTAHNRLVDAITYRPLSVRQEGQIFKGFSREEKRPYRSHAGNRERQLLKQISTQLFFALQKLRETKKIQDKAVEVQMMHMTFGGHQNLFIAANEHALSQYLPVLIQNRENFLRLITQTYSTKGQEGKRRSARYAIKLANRLLGDEIKRLPYSNRSDYQQACEIVKLMRNGEVRLLEIRFESDTTLSQNTQNALHHILTRKENGIYIMVIKNCSQAKRHAEEFICDVAEYANQLGRELDTEVHTCVGGKKRPCMTCTGRMTNTINKFGQYPSRIWKEVFSNQPETIAARTLKVLLEQPPTITVCEDKTTLERGYDSGSDSESDEKTGISGKQLATIQEADAYDLVLDGTVTFNDLRTLSEPELKTLSRPSVYPWLHKKLASVSQLMALFRHSQPLFKKIILDNSEALTDALGERGIGLQEFLVLYGRSPIHLRCLTEDIAQLVEDLSPGINATVMTYAEEEGVDFEEIADGLGETDEILFRDNLDTYFKEKRKNERERFRQQMS